MKLVIGNKNYSSWSLRAWLYLRESGLEFEEIRVSLFVDDWRERILRYSPAARVPVLVDGDGVVWDSLAIVLHVLETRPGALGWPKEPAARAMARSVVAEMHSGLMALRDELPQNVRARRPLAPEDLSAAARDQVARVLDIWEIAQRCGEGDWLFGDKSIADIFYAPVALRFVTYGVYLPPSAQRFVTAVRSLTSIQEWEAAAAAEPERLDFVDRLVPAAQSPLELG